MNDYTKSVLNELASAAKMHEVILNSYRNFHAKGLDYICLLRSPMVTAKLYFFDGKALNSPEVVVPHDHRYNFVTHVLHGQYIDYGYRENEHGEEMEAFEYRTPLCGGSGFTWNKTIKLQKYLSSVLNKGESFELNVPDIHTIQILRDKTVLFLIQYEDQHGGHTMAYRKSKEPPSLDGLYDSFTPDQINKRLESLGVGRVE